MRELISAGFNFSLLIFFLIKKGIPLLRSYLKERSEKIHNAVFTSENELKQAELEFEAAKKRQDLIRQHEQQIQDALVFQHEEDKKNVQQLVQKKMDALKDRVVFAKTILKQDLEQDLINRMVGQIFAHAKADVSEKTRRYKAGQNMQEILSQ